MKSSKLTLVFLLVFSITIISDIANAQQQTISNYLLFSGNGGNGATTPGYPGFGVQVSSSTTINGPIGSYTLVQSTGSTTINGDINSSGTVSLANSNDVTGNISAANSNNISGTVINIGSSVILNGNLDANGNIIVGGGVVNGTATLSGASTYSGPTPTGGIINGLPTLPVLPVLPTPTLFPSAGSTNITSNTTITPGAYGNMILTGKKRITFSGPGTYVFNSIQNSGNTNTFKFDFKNNSTGDFLIYVHGDVDLNKSNAQLLNGGSASRIYAETHGTGSSSSSGTVAWRIANGSSGNNSNSKWMGSIYAPYAAISIGSGTGSSNLTGAFWSGTQVTVSSGVSLFYEPFIFCSTPIASAGTDKTLTCSINTVVLDGSASTAGAQYNWLSTNGGNIVSGSNTHSPTVDAAGTYIITVTVSGGCSASDTVQVFLNNTLPDVDAGENMELNCKNSTVVLNGSSSTAGAAYNWTGPGIVSGNTIANPTVNLPGVYTLVVTDTQNGCTATDNATVGLNTTSPDVEAGPPNALNCVITEITLQGSSATASALFSWTFSAGGVIDSGATSATPSISGIATYYLTVTDSLNGCSATDSVVIGEGPCILPYYYPCPDGKVSTILGCELSSLYNNYVSGTDTIDDIFIFSGDSVWIELISIAGQTQNLFNLIYHTPGYGLTDTIPNGLNPLIITGKYPIVNLANLEIAPVSLMINYVRPVFPAIFNSGVITSQGDKAQASDFARNGFNVDGTGVKVCVLSDSYNTILGDPAQTDIVNGDLPGVGSPTYTTPVDIIGEYPYGSASDEGRAMLQIVHDVAPGAELGFRTGVLSEGDLAAGIIECAQSGCTVIADDITFVTSPFFQDGVVARAVDSVTAMGVKYFVAAGNFDSKGWSGQYNAMAAPLGFPGTSHDFGSGDNLQSITLEPGAYTVVLQWEDSIYSLGQTSTGTVNDFDIYITNEFGSQYFGFNHINTGGDPYEILPFIVPGSNPVSANFTIIRASGNQSAKLKYVVFRGEATINEYNTGKSTIVGQANAEGAITVGAVNYFNTPAYGGPTPPVVQNFSSRGGTETNGVIRSKPDIVAPNGGNTTVQFGAPNVDGDAFPNFFGTSAATPHVAGVAALLLDARMKYYGLDISPAEMKTLLTSTAMDMDVPGLDYATGSGYLQADSAMLTFASPTPIASSLTPLDTTIVPGSAPLDFIVEGQYFTTQSFIVFNGDTLPTTFLNTSQLEATLSAYGVGNYGLVVITTPISTSTSDGGVSDTLFFSDPIKKKITITADNKSKLYGEAMPEFSVAILVDSIPLDSTSFTFADLGLDSIVFTSPATTTSNTGIYFILPSANVVDPGYLTLFEYEFNIGLITIGNMPLVISPLNDTITYGDEIDGTFFEFDYDYDDSNILLSEQAAFLSNLVTSHTENIVEPVALIDDQILINQRAIVSQDVALLSFMTTQRAIVSGRQRAIVNQRAIVSGFEYDTTKVIDISPESIFEYQVNPDTADLFGAGPITNSLQLQRAIVSQRAIVNQRAIVSGLTTQRAIVSGSAILNSATTGDTSSSDIVVIVDETDVSAPANDTIFDFLPIVMITGYESGDHLIAPPALLSSNFEIFNSLGTLTVLPAELTVTANDVEVDYGELPVYSFDVEGYKFADSLDTIFNGPPIFTVVDGIGDTITGPIYPPGTYSLLISGLTFIQPSNYIFNFVSGTLTVNPATLIVNPDTAFVLRKNPPPATYTSTYTGLSSPTTIISGPTYTLSPNYTGGNNSQAGLYAIIASNLVLSDPQNYSIIYEPGVLFVNPNGQGAKKIKAILNCVDTVTNHPSGFDFLALFEYENNNSTAVYVPLGPDNYITSSGSYSGSPPTFFASGGGSFIIPFDGQSLQWVVTSIKGNQKSSSASNASSTSNKCAAHLRIVTNEKLNAENYIIIYPNPTTGKITLLSDEELVDVQKIEVYDMIGKLHNLDLNIGNEGYSIDIDLSQLNNGLYIIKLTQSDKEYVFRVLKN